MTTGAICRILLLLAPKASEPSYGAFLGMWMKAGYAFDSYYDNGVSVNFAKGNWSIHYIKKMF